MSQYIEGVVNVTNASQTVTGTDTEWLADISVGDMFTVVGTSVVYDVGSVDSDTQITLSANYAGLTATGASYAIARDFTPTHNIPVPNKKDIETATFLKRALSTIDGLL